MYLGRGWVLSTNVCCTQPGIIIIIIIIIIMSIVIFIILSIPSSNKIVKIKIIVIMRATVADGLSSSPLPGWEPLVIMTLIQWWSNGETMT